MFTQISTLLDRLQHADFLVLFMEPIFFYGLLFGLLFFLVGYFMGDARARMTGLIVIAISCFMLYPYLKLSAKAVPRITAMSGHWMDGAIKEQNKRRYDTRFFFYGLGCVAAAGAAAGGGGAKLINLTVIVYASIMLFFALWLDMKEHEIYHPYIRHGTKSA
jgi:hypothetical protein